MTEHDDDSRDSGGASVADDHTTAAPSKSTGDTSNSVGSEGQSRREILKSAGALGLGGLLGSGASAVGLGEEASAAAASGDPWTFVAIPDTQNMVNGNGRDVKRARAITRWVEENVDEKNIAFVSHMGDMVFNANNDDHWPRIEEVMSPLDGLVPWSPNVGNHDYYHGNDKDSGAERFKEHFGESRFEGRDYFGGAGPKGKSFYQYFSAGGYDFLHLSLEYAPRNGHNPEDSDLPFGWAVDVLENHPDTPTIVTTHAYLRDKETGIAGHGTQIRDNLVKPNPQVFMVLCGHVPDENHLVHSNNAGEDVYTILTDFQHRDYGGNGWFRRLRFIPGGGDDAPDRIQVKTYSHWLEEYERDDDSEWHWDLDFDERFPGDGGGGGGPVEQSPYNGPHSVPGTLEAEHFDTGGEGVAYHDTTDDHYGGDYRDDEGVDIKPASEHDYTVGWIIDGEWLEYTVEVEEDGDYDLSARVASAAEGGSLSVSAEGSSVSASFDETGGWDTWTTVDLGTLSLTAGETVIRVEATDSHWNFNYLEFEAVNSGGGKTVSEGTYKLVNVNSGKVLEVDGGSTDHGATLQQWEYDGSDHQHWEVTHVGNGQYGLLAQHSGKAADVENVSTDNGADIHQWGWQGDDNQLWNIHDLGGGEYRIRSVHSDKVMDVSGYSTDNGGDVHQWSWHGDDNQRWRLEAVDDSSGGSGPGTDRLVNGDDDTLERGEHLESSNGDYRLYFQQGDGNLVIRATSSGDAKWASHTAGDGGTELDLQGDGNLVMRTADSDAIWASDTAGSGAGELVLEDDGALVLYDGETEVWSVNG